MLGIHRRSRPRAATALAVLAVLVGTNVAQAKEAPPGGATETTVPGAPTTQPTTTTTTTTLLAPDSSPPTTTATSTTTAPPTSSTTPPPSSPLCTISTSVRLGTRSSDARCLERVLIERGYHLVGPDDYFGTSSVTALRSYQSANGLVADGIAGPLTAGRLGIWSTGSTPPPTAPPTTTPAPPIACTISGRVVYNDRGQAARCVEQRLAQLGYSFVGPDDWYGASSVTAVRAYQRAQGLYVDGVVGPQTATRMGIWGAPAVVQAPAPAPAPSGHAGLPANSGSGRRIVYSRAQQRVWAVDGNGTVVRTHLVSGRRYEPYAGTYSVYSRSLYAYSADNPNVKWRYMVRFAYGPQGGRIGFHEIPSRFGVPLQSVSQLGQPLSGGCVRQSTPDALWMWNWAGIGTKVVVL